MKLKENELFEVERDDYVGFIDQIDPEARYAEQMVEDEYQVIRTYSKKNKKLLCTRYVPIKETAEPHFFVFEMPDDDERCVPKAKQKIVLQDREEVQAFFDVLGKWQKEHSHD